MKFKRNLRNKPQINIIPMIDVLFFLLVFFMLFTTFRTSPTGIDINLPSAQTVTEQEQSEVNISIDENEMVYYQEEMLEMDELRSRVRQAIEQEPETLIIIQADQGVSYQRLIEVMDGVRAVGGYRIALAAERRLN